MPSSRKGTVRGLQLLVVDDSAVVRELMTQILEGEGARVSTASDPVIALSKIKKSRPDVIISDVLMPRMDGIEFVRRLMAADPIPVIICSVVTGAGAEMSLRAMEAGAVAVITKPAIGVDAFLVESAGTLIEAIVGAAKARIGAKKTTVAVDTSTVIFESVASCEKIIAIGASIGGTEAITLLLRRLPQNSPGVVVVQHMPEGFTRAFADRMNEVCQIEVREAVHGEEVRSGLALIARGNSHLRLARHRGKYFVEYSDGPHVSGHKPSVDVLFSSIAQAAGRNAVGVILTGMGTDGAKGLLEMKKAGSRTIAQDEASCVVFGMPREAILLGAVDEIAGIEQISGLMLSRAKR